METEGKKPIKWAEGAVPETDDPAFGLVQYRILVACELVFARQVPIRTGFELASKSTVLDCYIERTNPSVAAEKVWKWWDRHRIIPVKRDVVQPSKGDVQRLIDETKEDE